MGKNDLESLREQIDELDQTIVNALEQRWQVVLAVAKYKQEHNLTIFDPAREEKVIQKACDLLVNKKYNSAITAVMQVIMEQSKVMEQSCLSSPQKDITPGELQVGCFGMPGSYSHQALEKYFLGSNVNRQYFSSFEEVVKAVSDGVIKYGVLPIENSSTGGITEVYDLLRHYDCFIVGEQCIKIEHNLVGIAEAELSDITTVYSHPQGLAQSKEFFRKYPQIELIPYFSTSKSAENIHKQQNKHLAAVASKQAAKIYQLKVLAENINYNTNNYTRFIIISREAEAGPNANKITIVVAVKHETGSLYRTLGHLYHSGLNMMNLESRPIEGRSWEYFFHVDLVGNLKEQRVVEALNQLEQSCVFCKVLGNYQANNL